MRPIAIGVGVIVLAVAGVLAFMTTLSARDDATLGASAGPGKVRPEGARPAVAPGNIVLLDGDERLTDGLRELALQTGGPTTPALVKAGQAVVVRRQAGLRVPVAALTTERRFDASGPEDPQLRAFIEYWIGRREAG